MKEIAEITRIKLRLVDLHAPHLQALEWSGWPLNPIAARPGRPSHEAAAPPGTDRPGSDLALSA